MHVLNYFPPHLHKALTMPQEHKMHHEHRMSMSAVCCQQRTP